MALNRALLSVSDKTGIVELARGLQRHGIEIISTGGTRKVLTESGLDAREVSEITGFPEMMDGRVKTLHPRVHGGILALRDREAHRRAMEEHGIGAIDLVCISLYPFEKTVAREGVSLAEAIEQIDIGGPSMLRSAAKNHAFVTVLVDPSDYPRILAELDEHGEVLDATRAQLALKAFETTARYDAAIARYLRSRNPAAGRFPESFTLTGGERSELRYGENPHQGAAFYRIGGLSEPSVATGEVLGGKALSFNNIFDLDAALALVKEFDAPAVAVIKHTNPCGCADAGSLVDALAAAWSGDPLSAFGSVVGFNRSLDLASAEFLTSENRFVECVVAPDYDEDALEVLRTRPRWGKNVRLLRTGPFDARSRDASDLDVKKVVGGLLVQERDLLEEDPSTWKVATQRAPKPDELGALAFAWKVCKHVKSNAIVLVQSATAPGGSGVLVGVGAGQMSRVDSVEIACRKAGDRARGAVLASDAFFPFPDGVETAAAAGVRSLVQPGGSRRDEEVVAAADRLELAMLFTGARHFRH